MGKKIMITMMFYLFSASFSNAKDDNSFYIEGDWPSWRAEIVGEVITFSLFGFGIEDEQQKIRIVDSESDGKRIVAFHSDDFYIYGFIHQLFDHYSFCGYDYESNKKQFEVLIQVDNKAFQGCTSLKE